MSKQLHIRLLGSLQIEVDGEPLTDLGTRKAEALLAYLVCHERPFPREALAEMLWADRDLQQAMANFRSLLSGMRSKLKPYLTITRQSVAFNHDSSYRLDVAEFQQLAANQENSSADQAMALYRGDFLDGLYVRDSRAFEEWALLERERLQRTAVSLLWQLINAHIQQGSYAAALPHVNHLLRLDNLSERAHRHKMMLLARSGQLNAAIGHYDTCCQILDTELGVAPAPETQSLYRQILAARDTKRPPLPPPLPHFVGRLEEQARLLNQLRQPACRLLTLLGPGGMGKTRLAIESARYLETHQPGQFLHGIWFVPLAGLADARLLAPTLLAALGIATAESENPEQTLIDYLKAREVLLLLDNFEQLSDGVDLLARLLAAAPQIKLLVTSQEPLHLHEEWMLDLGGLAVPAADAGETAVSFSAVQLFLQIAQRLHPHYAPSPEDLTAIAHICRLLEGMPLGIELAAVWIRHFPPPQIAAEVARGLDILATQIRNVPSRHRSLRAIFDYSRQLLPPDVQAIFPQLGLFRDIFTADAAAGVAGASQQQLRTLVEKSLLRQHGDGRYSLHPMLRQYAIELLAASPADQAAYTRQHATYHLNLLRANHPAEDPEQRSVVLAVLPDIRAAWLWASQHDYAALLDSAVTLHSFYSAQSWFREGIDAFDYALGHLPDTAVAQAQLAQTRAELLSRKARMHIHIGQLEKAAAALDTAQAALQLVEDPQRLSTILGYVAITAYYAGDMPRAEALARQSLAKATEIEDLDGVGFCHNFLGSCLKAQGLYTQAKHHFEQATAVYRQLKDELGEAMVVNNLGNVAQAMGDFAAARDYYLTCSRLFKAHNHMHGASTTLANAGRLATKQADFVGATALLTESLALKREMEDERGTAVALVGLADVAVATESFADAQQYLREALQLADNSGDVKLVVETLAVLGKLYARQQQQLAAAQLLAFALAHPAMTQEVREGAEAYMVQADAAMRRQGQSWAAQQDLASLTASLLASLS